MARMKKIVSSIKDIEKKFKTTTFSNFKEAYTPLILNLFNKKQQTISTSSIIVKSEIYFIIGLFFLFTEKKSLAIQYFTKSSELKYYKASLALIHSYKHLSTSKEYCNFDPSNFALHIFNSFNDKLIKEVFSLMSKDEILENFVITKLLKFAKHDMKCIFNVKKYLKTLPIEQSYRKVKILNMIIDITNNENNIKTCTDNDMMDSIKYLMKNDNLENNVLLSKTCFKQKNKFFALIFLKRAFLQGYEEWSEIIKLCENIFFACDVLEKIWLNDKLEVPYKCKDWILNTKLNISCLIKS